MSSPSAPERAPEHRCGHVAIVGRPNVGKSTLLNRLVGCKLSITSSKPQTTRRRITGIVTRPDAQIIFVDTPGYQTEHRSLLNQAMNRSVAASVHEVDLLLWVVEALVYDERDHALLRLLPAKPPLVIAINKIDRVRDKKLLLPFIARLAAEREAAAIVPISATTGLQVDDLLATVAQLLPPGPPLYDEDELTTESERTLAAELVREKLVRLLGAELPYACAVEIERFETAGELRRIYAAVLVEKESQKAIVIGRGGEKLKAIATRARRDMERLFGGRVYLEVWVKARRGWSENRSTVQRLGYGE